MPDDLASLNGRSFRFDPTSVNWNFSLKTAEHPTLGGKVVQVFGTRIEDMTVEGTFGSGGWEAQEEFLQQIKVLTERQADKRHLPPVKFLVPSQGFDFDVYIKDFTTPDGGARSIRLSSKVFSPTWKLTLMVVDDHTVGLKEVATDLFISRISAGIGWRKSEYSGPMSFDEVRELISPFTLNEYLVQAFEPAAAAAAGLPPLPDIVGGGDAASGGFFGL